MISRKRSRFTRAILRFRFGDQAVQPSGLGIRLDLTVPQFLPVFLQPTGHHFDFFRRQLGDGCFDVLDRAHAMNVKPNASNGNQISKVGLSLCHSVLCS